MTFAARESSRKDGEPISLFLFVGAGAGEVPYFAELESSELIGPYAYTNAETPITRTEEGFAEPVTYLPVPIQRGALTSSSTLDKAMLEVRMQQGTELAGLFLAYPPSQVINLIVREGHVGDDPADPENFLVVWAGRVLGAQHPVNETVFNCEPLSTSMRRPGLRRNAQPSCPHVLYGPQCRASLTAATVTTTVNSVQGNRITLQPGWNGKPFEKYIGGMVRWTHPNGSMVLRDIIRIDNGVTIVLGGPSTALIAGQEVKVALGCNHSPGMLDTTGDCQNLHNNILNFGGQPFMPNVNPMSGINNFY